MIWKQQYGTYILFYFFNVFFFRNSGFFSTLYSTYFYLFCFRSFRLLYLNIFFCFRVEYVSIAVFFPFDLLASFCARHLSKNIKYSSAFRTNFSFDMLFTLSSSSFFFFSSSSYSYFFPLFLYCFSIFFLWSVCVLFFVSLGSFSLRWLCTSFTLLYKIKIDYFFRVVMFLPSGSFCA